MAPEPENEPVPQSDPLDALRAGDVGPFEAFVRRETRSFFGFFRHLGADPAEAEDLTQDVFTRLFHARDAYRPQVGPLRPGGRFRAYAFRVARNVWIDRGRRRAVRPRLWEASEAQAAALEERATGDAGPGARLAEREEAERAQAALGALSTRHREVFELAVVRELAYPEIAALLSIPVGTVKSRVFYAVRRLRELLEATPRSAPSAARERSVARAVVAAIASPGELRRRP